jgi:hypothetical protein
LFTSENAVIAVETYDFTDIEPFIMVMIEWNPELRLCELVWEGAISHFAEKPFARHIGSSSILYSEAMKKKRETWFSEFIFNNLQPSEADLLKFHKTAGDGNLEPDVVMDWGFLKTKNITQFSKFESSGLRYEDLQTKQITQHNF